MVVAGSKRSAFRLRNRPARPEPSRIYLHGWISREQVLEAYEVLKKNQYGKYLKDVLDGKYVDKLHMAQ